MTSLLGLVYLMTSLLGLASLITSLLGLASLSSEKCLFYCTKFLESLSSGLGTLNWCCSEEENAYWFLLVIDPIAGRVFVEE